MKHGAHELRNIDTQVIKRTQVKIINRKRNPRLRRTYSILDTVKNYIWNCETFITG